MIKNEPLGVCVRLWCEWTTVELDDVAFVLGKDRIPQLRRAIVSLFDGSLKHQALVWRQREATSIPGLVYVLSLSPLELDIDAI